MNKGIIRGVIVMWIRVGVLSVRVSLVGRGCHTAMGYASLAITRVGVVQVQASEALS